MDYKQENKQIERHVEKLFEQAKRKCGSWAKVADELEIAYSSVARYRRTLQDGIFPSLLIYFRLCKIVEGQDCLQDDLDHFVLCWKFLVCTMSGLSWRNYLQCAFECGIMTTQTKARS